MALPEGVRAIAPVAAAFAALLGLMVWLFDGLLEQRRHPNHNLAAGPDGPGPVELEPGPGGQYRAPGRINGERVTFLLDTGASHVAVPGGLADELGLERGPETRVVTASGTATAYHTRIDRIELGGLRVDDVRGSINPAMGGDAVLLGMTFLREVDFSQRDGRLILEAPDRR